MKIAKQNGDAQRNEAASEQPAQANRPRRIRIRIRRPNTAPRDGSHRHRVGKSPRAEKTVPATPHTVGPPAFLVALVVLTLVLALLVWLQLFHPLP